MCLMHPEGHFDCANRYGSQPCKNTITFDVIPSTVSECFARLESAGWAVVPATGTLIVCPDCIQPWMRVRMERGH